MHIPANNSLETEAKFFVLDLSRIEARLRQIGAGLVQPRTYEINYRFDTPGQDLRRTGKVLRLRKDNLARLTFKGTSNRREGVLSREEIEFVVEDFEKARQFLEALGYEMLLLYEKYRTTYKLVDTHIMLDEVPYGNFVEIEGLDISSIKQAANSLSLRWEAAVSASYHALFERLAQTRALDRTKMIFTAFQDLEVRPEELSLSPAD
jgi:adenylate cyclase class 2